MRVSVRGFTLPWQLVELHEPGPVYFPASVCEMADDLFGDAWGAAAHTPPARAAKHAIAVPAQNATTRQKGRQISSRDISDFEHIRSVRLREVRILSGSGSARGVSREAPRPIGLLILPVLPEVNALRVVSMMLSVENAHEFAGHAPPEFVPSRETLFLKEPLPERLKGDASRACLGTTAG